MGLRRLCDPHNAEHSKRVCKPSHPLAGGKRLPNFEYTIYEMVSEARIAIGVVMRADYERFPDKCRTLEYVERCRILVSTLANLTPAMTPALDGHPTQFLVSITSILNRGTTS
jgi:hypothetical protein